MKLLVCDVEGTIFKAKYKIEGTDYASTMWQPLAHCLGETAIQEEVETHKKWENKEYNNYVDWVYDTYLIHKKHKLHKSIFCSLIEEAEYNDGVVEFFKQLDRSKYVPVLVSGGFQELVRRAQRELDIRYGYGACEYFFNQETGELTDCSLTPCDFDGKFNYVNALFNIYNVDHDKDWIFIGDGKNDVHIAERAPIAIGINAHPELKRVIKNEHYNDFWTIRQRILELEDVVLLGPDDFIDDDGSLSTASKYEDNAALLMERDSALAKAEAVRVFMESRHEELCNELQERDEIIILMSDEMSEEKERHMQIRTRLENDKKELEQKLNSDYLSRRKRLQDFWTRYFKHFTFKAAVLKAAAKLSYSDLVRLEDKLIELYGCPDPRVLSRGKLHGSGDDHTEVILTGGVRARLDYRILDGAGPKVEITNFYPRKDLDKEIN